jgi:hypothetical protein
MGDILGKEMFGGLGGLANGHRGMGYWPCNWLWIRAFGIYQIVKDIFISTDLNSKGSDFQLQEY